MQPELIKTFLIEAADLLDQVDEAALDLERRAGEAEPINRLFRAFHTIKGSGAMFGFEAVAAFTHHVETLLQQVRDGLVAPSAELVALVLASRDHIQRLLAATPVEAAALQSGGDELARSLATLAGGPGAVPAAVTRSLAPEAVSDPVRYAIRFRPNPQIAAGGLDPAAVLEELRRLGPCEIAVHLDRVPELGTLDPALCLLEWTVTLTTAGGVNAIRDAFIFCEDGAELHIEPQPVLPAASVTRAGVSTAASPSPIAAEDASVAAAERSLKSLRDGVVRVPSAKLDRIVALVGELVMNQSRLLQVAERLNTAELTAPVEAIERLVAEMRDAVLGVRMMPIGSTFSRFKRLVHDLAHDLGKDVELITEGGETELDKTVLDQLGDPLVHLIRNSIDHGIGTPVERRAAGKPPRGTLRLTASHHGSHVVVTVQDDGRGLDAGAIRAKAVERQLIAPDAKLGDAELYNLIFVPGFSTARNVTAVSGRGVGMDVVRRQIDALRGGIQLSSVPGTGTTVTLSLPLTLAIIEGLLVSVAGDPFIIPMSVVMENVELARADRCRNNGRNLVNVRGELIPYLHVRELFGAEGEEPAIEKIVIARYGSDRVGLVVDRVLGSHQTVIQPLGRMLKDIGVVSGGTILGDGRVALILDLAGIVAVAGAADRRAAA